MTLTRDNIVTIAKRLYLIGVVIYLINFATQTVLMAWAFSPGVEKFSHPLAVLLQFLELHLRGLTSGPTAMICIVAAFILHPTITSMVPKGADDDLLPEQERREVPTE